MTTNEYPQRIYVDAQTGEVVIENPDTTERVFASYAWFQSLFNVGVKYVNTTVSGMWYDLNEREVIHIKRNEQVRVVGQLFKRGIKLWWPEDGTLRIVRAYAHGPQKVYLAVATEDNLLHEHYTTTGREPYRSLAPNCNVCNSPADLQGLEFDTDALGAPHAATIG